MVFWKIYPYVRDLVTREWWILYIEELGVIILIKFPLVMRCVNVELKTYVSDTSSVSIIRITDTDRDGHRYSL
jgi:hypothetical protein